MNKNIVIPKPENLEEIKKSFRRGGAERLHVLADFDKTLTTAFIGGKKFVSVISLLRDGNYLTSDYAPKAHALYAKYRPIEIDPKIPFEEKKKMMREWWMTHFDLLIKSGLNKKDIKKAVESGNIKLRDGFGEFEDFLRSRGIPLVILSSSGLGVEGISMYLEKEEKMHDNIYIISNAFEWDKNGNAAGVRRPVIHSLNKQEQMAEDFPFFSKIKDRKNVILLGDSMDDAEAIQGFDYENLIKIGFLNENAEENLERYKKIYDAVILDDSSMDYANQLVKEIAVS